jgi:hypothetical protein
LKKSIPNRLAPRKVTRARSASHTGTLYIGVTSNLYLRVMEHKKGTLEGFTADDFVRVLNPNKYLQAGPG